MNIELLKKLGNLDQLAGIREAQLLRGRGQHIQLAEFHNAAGLQFSVVPDRGMDIFDLRYKGINLAFQSKNGLTSPQAFSAADGEFCDQWPGGALVTCGLDNVGGHSSVGGINPTHGRYPNVPASRFGTESYWDGDDYILRATGETHQTKLYGRHLSLRRTVQTSLNSKVIKLTDVITNFEAEDEPYMILYHINFGYPLLDENTKVEFSQADITPMNGMSNDPVNMMAPVDGRGEELYLRTGFGDKAWGVIYNEALEIGVYVAWDTKNLPNALEWKNMKSHDYVLAMEPCNTCGLNRDDALAQGKIPAIPGYSSVTNTLEIGILDGMDEIRAFLKG